MNANVCYFLKAVSVPRVTRDQFVPNNVSDSEEDEVGNIPLVKFKTNNNTSDIEVRAFFGISPSFDSDDRYWNGREGEMPLPLGYQMARDTNFYSNKRKRKKMEVKFN